MNTSEEKYRDLFRNQLDDQSPEEFHEELWLEALAKLEAEEDKKPVAAPLPSNDGTQRSWSKWGLLLLLFTTVASLGYLLWPKDNLADSKSRSAEVRPSENNDLATGTTNKTTTAQTNNNSQSTNTSPESTAIASNTDNSFASNSPKTNKDVTSNSPTSSGASAKQTGPNSNPQNTISGIGTESTSGMANKPSKSTNLVSKPSKTSSSKATKVSSSGSSSTTSTSSVKSGGNNSLASNGLDGNSSVPTPPSGTTGQDNPTNSSSSNQNNGLLGKTENTIEPNKEFVYLNNINGVWGNIEFANTPIDSRAFGPVPSPPPPGPTKSKNSKKWEYGLLLGRSLELGAKTYYGVFASANVQYNLTSSFGLQLAPGAIFHEGSQAAARTSRVEVYSFDSIGTSRSYRPINAFVFELPLLFSYRPSPKHNLFVGAGTSFLFASLSEVKSQLSDGSSTESISLGYNTELGRIGAFGRMGYQWRFSKHFHLNLAVQRELVLQNIAPWSIRLGLSAGF